MDSPKTFLLPDLFAICPLQGGTNPHYREAGAESAEWINGYNVFTDRKKAYFIQGYNELLVSHTYPYAGYEQFRTCCDFVNLLFVIDEVSDDQNGADARTTGETFLNIMRDPGFADYTPLAMMTRDFRTRYMRLAKPVSASRFLEHCKNYVNAVAMEAELREKSHVLDIEAFLKLRRENSAVRLCFALIEYVQGTDLPDQVHNDPVFKDAYMAGIDLVCWANDVYSYNVEQAKGHSGNNIVTVLIKEKNLSLQAASDYVGSHCAKLMAQYTNAIEQMPSWGPSIDAGIERFFEGASHWIRGNLDWSFETNRYFGSQHLTIKTTRLVRLRPQSQPEDFDSDSEQD